MYCRAQSILQSFPAEHSCFPMMRQVTRLLHSLVFNKMSVSSLCTKFHPEVYTSITSRIVPSTVKPKSEHCNALVNCSAEPTNPASVHQELLLSTFIVSHNKPNNNEWDTLITKLLEKRSGDINQNNMDFKIMGSCVPLKKLDLARSYLDFVKQSRKFDGAIVCEFLKVCYNCRSLLTDGDFKRVKKFTEFLRQKYIVIDSYIGEGVIKGLLLQSNINASLSILEQIKKTDSVNEETYSALILHLLENGTTLRAKRLIKEMLESYDLPDQICLKWIDISKSDRAKLDALLNFLRECDYKPKKAVRDYLVEVYGQLPGDGCLIGKYGRISERGQCPTCGNHLAQIYLTDKDYECLKDIVINRVLMGQDVFKNTMPYELEKFFRLMEQYAPFDIIIDGLNVGYITGRSGSTLTYVKVIEDVLKLFAERHCEMIFIGKWHMRKWPGLLDMIRHYGARYFFVEDISTDDPYILGATLYSGTNARFVTRDTMKTEQLKLKNSEETRLFRRWRRSHNIRLKYIHSTKKIIIQEPFTHEMVIQPTKNGGWHIPCPAERSDSLKDIIIKNWLCLYPVATVDMK